MGEGVDGPGPERESVRENEPERKIIDGRWLLLWGTMTGVPGVGDDQIWRAHCSMTWGVSILVQMETMG